MIPVLTAKECQKAWKERQYPAQKTYLAFYSSLLGGITKDPNYMTIPVDDHVVHRGDGVFEAIKCKEGRVYLWKAHTDRLKGSCEGLGLKYPENLEEVVSSTVKASGTGNCIIRIFVTRGPGHFSANPYDSIGAQLYVMVTPLTAPNPALYSKGARLGRSRIPPKEAWLAQIKTCNYIPNVMMKKEAIDRKLDFTVGIGAQNFITEGSTENIVVLTQNNMLVRPHYDQILKGTTMGRVLVLADNLKSQGLIHSVGEKNMGESDLISAKEVMLIGTTLDVLPVTAYEGKPISQGRVGPVAQALLQLLHQDQVDGPDTWLLP